MKILWKILGGLVLAIIVVPIATLVYWVEYDDTPMGPQMYVYIDMNTIYATNLPSGITNDLLLNNAYWTIREAYLDNDDKLLLGTWKMGESYSLRKKKDGAIVKSKSSVKDVDPCGLSFVFKANKSFLMKTNSVKAGCTVSIDNKQHWDIIRTSPKNIALINQGAPLAIDKITADSIIFALGESEGKEKISSYFSLVRRK